MRNPYTKREECNNQLTSLRFIFRLNLKERKKIITIKRKQQSNNNQNNNKMTRQQDFKDKHQAHERTYCPASPIQNA